MTETFQTDYHSVTDMGQESVAVWWRTFFVFVAGRTNGAHEDIVSKLKSRGQTQVFSHQGSDYFLVFCPIASRVGTDITEALETIPDGKPIILVVMHHTFNPDQVVAPSRRQVENPNVRLTVDYLFYERKLLQCERNNAAWREIETFLGLPSSPVLVSVKMDWLRNHWKWVLIICLGALIILLIIILVPKEN